MSSNKSLRARVISLAAAAMLALSACGGNYNVYNDQGPMYNVNVDCAPEGNEDGFSMELPRCYCNGGIKFSLIVDKGPDGQADRYIEFRRGYLSDDGFESVIKTYDGHTIDEMFVIHDGEKVRVTDPDVLERSTQTLADNNRLFLELYNLENYCASLAQHG